MKQLLREAKLRDLATKMKQEGRTKSEITIVIGELKQNSVSIGLSFNLGFVKLYNN